MNSSVSGACKEKNNKKKNNNKKTKKTATTKETSKQKNPTKKEKKKSYQLGIIITYHLLGSSRVTACNSVYNKTGSALSRLKRSKPATQIGVWDPEHS